MTTPNESTFQTIAGIREIQDIGSLTADEWAVVAEFLKLYRQARQHDRKSQITCYFRDGKWYLARSAIAASGLAQSDDDWQKGRISER